MSKQIILIPARGGSKRLENKNIRLLKDRSLLQRSMDIGIAMGIDTWISTDMSPAVLIGDGVIVDLPSEKPPDMSFIPRPYYLARNTTAMIEVLRHAVGYVQGRTGRMIDRVILLQPTSPLREVGDVEGCIRMFESDRCRESGMAVCTCVNRERNGAVYIYPAARIMSDEKISWLHYQMPPNRSVDIDLLSDWRRAEEYLDSLTP